MKNLTIKREWIAPDLAARLAAACYSIAKDQFHKQNLYNLLAGLGGATHVDTARAIVDMFWESPIPDFYEAAYGEKCAVWLDFSTLRYHQIGRPETHVPWHFDYNFFTNDPKSLVSWIPFDTVGEQAPGLEFCLPAGELNPENFARILVDGRLPASLDDDTIDTLLGPGNQHRITPKLGLGDAFLFDGFVLHRTQPMAQATASRLAIEFRMTSAVRPSARLKAESSATLSYRLDDGTPVVRPYAALFPNT